MHVELSNGFTKRSVQGKKPHRAFRPLAFLCGVIVLLVGDPSWPLDLKAKALGPHGILHVHRR